MSPSSTEGISSLKVMDERSVPRPRPVNHLRLLRSFHPRAEESRQLEEERRPGKIADPEDPWEIANA